MILQFLKFRSICTDFSVPAGNITVLATEATRTAPNSAEFIAAIKDAVGWDVTLLAKEDEGRIGAMGVYSSLGNVKGLVMDLGGGSTQLTWLYTSPSGTIQMPQGGSVSMPYGAAAMSRRLEEARAAGGTAVDDLAAEIGQAVKQAYTSLAPPREIENPDGSVTLYLSGGGFRGWGFILLSSHEISPYPIPIINGFSVPSASFLDTSAVQAAVSSSASDSAEEEGGIFRVSARRASQVPAVAFLVRALTTTLSRISTVTFCQGGVREGYLFSSLPPSVQQQHPLVAATQHYASSPGCLKLLIAALPHPCPLEMEVLEALANSYLVHQRVGKDSRASVALRFPVTGEMAAAHGLAHTDRAKLGMALASVHGKESDLPPGEREYFDRLGGLLGKEMRWWLRYVGKVAGLIAGVHPAGLSEGTEARVRFGAVVEETKKHPEGVVRLSVRFKGGEAKQWLESMADQVVDIEKVGKRKAAIDGFGMKVKVDVECD